MSKIFISPSILSADFSKLGDECKSLEKSSADWIHFDVMDGNFVPNISFGIPVLKSVRKCVVLPLDVHLMIDKPERYVKQFAESGADIITFHLEATDNVLETCNLIRSFGKKVGISVKPNTPVQELLPYKGYFDLVLVMSVEPGFGGQKFIESSYEKIRLARSLFPECLIEVDGGVNLDNASKIISSGCDVLVAGNAVFSSTNREEAIRRMKGE